MFGLHTEDLVVVLLIALIIFGPRKLPEIGSAIGKSIREFKKATTETGAPEKAPEPKPLPLAPGANSAEVQQASLDALPSVRNTQAEKHEGAKLV